MRTITPLILLLFRFSTPLFPLGNLRGRALLAPYLFFFLSGDLRLASLGPSPSLLPLGNLRLASLGPSPSLLPLHRRARSESRPKWREEKNEKKEKKEKVEEKKEEVKEKERERAGTSEAIGSPLPTPKQKFRPSRRLAPPPEDDDDTLYLGIVRDLCDLVPSDGHVPEWAILGIAFESYRVAKSSDGEEYVVEAASCSVPEEMKHRCDCSSKSDVAHAWKTGCRCRLAHKYKHVVAIKYGCRLLLNPSYTSLSKFMDNWRALEEANIDSGIFFDEYLSMKRYLYDFDEDASSSYEDCLFDTKGKVFAHVIEKF